MRLERQLAFVQEGVKVCVLSFYFPCVGIKLNLTNKFI